MSISPGIVIFSDKSIIRIGRHLTLILLMILVFTWVISQREEGAGYFNIFPAVSINALFFFSYAYITAYLLVPGLLLRRNYLFFIVAFLISGFAISWLKFFVSDILFYSAIADNAIVEAKKHGFQQFLVNTKDMSFIVAIFLIAKYARDNYYMKQRKAELKEFGLKEEIRLIKNQLDPHIVFNHLNNLYSLAVNSSIDLPLEINRFHSILCYYFKEGKQDCVKLKEELISIRNFIALEELRYRERLSVNFQIEGHFEGKVIAPFILLRFIENAFEHGISSDSGKVWITVRVAIKGDRLFYHVSNSKPFNILDHKGASRKMLNTVNSKLLLYYRGRHRLRVEGRENSFSVDLQILMKNGPDTVT